MALVSHLRWQASRAQPLTLFAQMSERTQERWATDFPQNNLRSESEISNPKGGAQRREEF